MELRPLMTLRLNTAPVQNIGATPFGTRVTFPITGGFFEGERLCGRTLPGGDDWTRTRSDGVIELDLRVSLETDEGALIHMTFEGIRDDGALIHMASFGLRHGPPDVIAALARGESVDPSTYYFRTTPRFDTGHPKYAFLNRLVAVSSGDRRPEGPIYTIEEIL